MTATPIAIALSSHLGSSGNTTLLEHGEHLLIDIVCDSEYTPAPTASDGPRRNPAIRTRKPGDSEDMAGKV